MIHLIKEKNKLIEMAQVDQINDLVIQVYTDHNPPHFHVIKKDKFDVRISIENAEVLSYKFQKNNAQISSNELKKIESWLDKTNKDVSDSNRKVVKLLWKSMNKK